MDLELLYETGIKRDNLETELVSLSDQIAENRQAIVDGQTTGDEIADALCRKYGWVCKSTLELIRHIQAILEKVEETIPLMIYFDHRMVYRPECAKGNSFFPGSIGFGFDVGSVNNYATGQLEPGQGYTLFYGLVTQGDKLEINATEGKIKLTLSKMVGCAASPFSHGSGTGINHYWDLEEHLVADEGQGMTHVVCGEAAIEHWLKELPKGHHIAERMDRFRR